MWQVIGQEWALSLLRRSLEKKTLAHAYIFSGPHNVGKMTLAINLAQALNCQSDEKPCGECAACLKTLQGKHADVQVIDIDSAKEDDEVKRRTEIGIKQIRQLQHSASLPPFEGRYKVFIIDGAELLSTEAANCLLKTLEEPAEKIVFILLTANAELILPTVMSRCQELKLNTMSVEAIAAVLKDKYNVEPQQADLLSRLCHGCIGWAISAVLDDKTSRQYFEKREGMLETIQSDCEERFAYAEKLARQFGQKREDAQQILDIWLDVWRDLLLLKSGCGGLITNIDIKDKLKTMVEEYRLDSIRRFIDDIKETGERLGRNANPRLALEVLMLDIPERGRERVKG
ncbi:DNA polymerase III subunit delta' [Chloroflexota bacterium]